MVESDMTINIAINSPLTENYSLDQKNALAKQILALIEANKIDFVTTVGEARPYIGRKISMWSFSGNDIEGILEQVGFSAQDNRDYVVVDGKTHYTIKSFPITVKP